MKRICLFAALLLSFHVRSAAPDSVLSPPIRISPPVYVHLKGKIDGKYAITMDMLIAPWGGRGSNKKIVVNGSYYYDVIKESIFFFWGTYQGDDINIRPGSGDGSESFSGKFDGSEYKGKWTSTDATAAKGKVRHLSFVLKVDTGDCVKLSLHSFIDSFVAYKKLVNTPAVFYEHELLLPDSGQDEKLSEILYRLYGKANSYDAMVKSIRRSSRQYIENFKKNDMANAQKGDKDYPCWQYFCQYRINYDTRILYNSQQLLSFRYTRYSDEGGNHGYAEPHYYSYSVKHQRLVKVSDIVNARDTVVLKKCLSRRIRQLYHLPANDSSVDDAAPLPDNFYVTPTGIAFLYPAFVAHLEPYDVFIPFNEISAILKRQVWME